MPKQAGRQQDFSFMIKGHLGILGTSQSGWTKEINLVEWNGNPAKLDIRDWDASHEHMSRGITLRREETLILLEVLLRNYGRDLIKRQLSTAKEVADMCRIMEEEEENPSQQPEQSEQSEQSGQPEEYPQSICHEAEAGSDN